MQYTGCQCPVGHSSSEALSVDTARATVCTRCTARPLARPLIPENRFHLPPQRWVSGALDIGQATSEPLIYQAEISDRVDARTVSQFGKVISREY